MEQARVGLIVALMCGLCLSARAGAAQDVKIGMMSPGGDVGKHAVEGARIAVEELNAAGGLHGRKVTLEVAEDGCDAAKAQAAFSALALRSGVVVVIGSFCRASVVATSSLGAQSGVLHLSGVRLETDILDKAGEGFYSRAYHTEEWTRILGQELLKQGAKSTELVAATDTFSKVAAKGLSTATGKAPRAFLLTAFQLDAKSAWAAGTTPDGLIFVGPAPVDASNIKFARAAGVKLIALGAEPTPSWIQAAGVEAERVMVATSYPYNRGKVQSFVDKFAKTTGSKPYFYAQHAYDMVRLFASAASKAGSIETRAIRMAVPGLTVLGLAGELKVSGKTVVDNFWPAQILDKNVVALEGPHGTGKGSP